MVKIELDKSTGTITKVTCKNCHRYTNHLVLKSAEESGSESMGPDIDFYWITSYQIIRCQGCDTLSFRSISTNSEEIDHRGGTIEYEDLYPSRTEGRKLLNGVNILPKDLMQIYRETNIALNSNQPVLAGIGIRAIIETVTKEKNASGGNLSDKIDNLVVLGVLTIDGAGILHKLRVLGNNAAHEVKVHSGAELILAMDVVEHLLQAVYILPFHAIRTFK
ncbi:DUF4145 domain-containing protein [Acidithiobacillus sp. MC6.1]|nr:DUF4145 domain-containing protein [Acidithiobacillus sp. MC6.1]